MQEVAVTILQEGLGRQIMRGECGCSFPRVSFNQDANVQRVKVFRPSTFAGLGHPTTAYSLPVRYDSANRRGTQVISISNGATRESIRMLCLGSSEERI